MNHVGIGEDEVLEALKNVRDRLVGLEEDEWAFSDWQRCTCGHIYEVTKDEESDRERMMEAGLLSSDFTAITNPEVVDGLYERVLEIIVYANPGWNIGEHRNLSTKVSNLTERLWRSNNDVDVESYDENDVELEAALELVDKTIAHIERRQLDAMDQHK